MAKKNLSVDMTELRKLESELLVFSNTAYPHAVRATMNKLAFVGRKIAQQKIGREFINRNKWTAGSIRFTRARGLEPNNMVSEFGSVAAYMATQESGGVIQKKGKHGVPIPTSYGAGQGETANPRTRLPRARNAMRNIKLNKKGYNIKSKSAQAQAVIRDAATTGRRVVYLDLPRSRGIFRVIGSGRRLRIKMLYDLSRTSIKITKHPIIEPSAELSGRQIAKFFREEILSQQKRLRLFED